MATIPTTTIPKNLHDTLTGAAILTGESVASRLRREIIKRVTDGWDRFEPVAEIHRGISEIIRRVYPIFAESFWHTELAAWLDAIEWNSKRLPKWLIEHLTAANSFGRSVPPSNPFAPWGLTPPDDDDWIKFPKIDAAARSLAKRALLTRDEFDKVSEVFRARSFTIAGDLGIDAIREVRDTLQEVVKSGPSLAKFKKEVENRIGTGAIGPSHLENVYRTNIQGAYRDGRETLLSDPVVSEAFPYQAYFATHDARTRPNHLALESLGLNGTGIYRRDDPFWERFTPPWDYNCRCTVILMTIGQAAKAGVVEAQKWLESGKPPLRPEYRWDKIPFQHNPGFGQRSGLKVAA